MASSDRYVKVPESWLRKLMERGEQVDKQLKSLPDPEFIPLMKTDIHALIGYVASAETAIEVGRI